MSPLRTLQLLHLAFCISILLFGIVVVLLIAPNAVFSVDGDQNWPFLAICPLIAVLGIICSNLLFKKLLGDLDSGTLTVSAKFTRYQTAFIVRCALIEGPALFNIVVSLITQNYLYLLFALACLTALWLARPTKDRICSTLQIQDPDSI